MVCKKGAPKYLAKFIEKHQRQSLFFNKVAGQACKFIKRETLTQVFFCEFCEIFKNTYFHKAFPVAASERCSKKFHESMEHMIRRLFFNKITSLQPSTLSKERLWHRCFFAKHLRVAASVFTSNCAQLSDIRSFS